MGNGEAPKEPPKLKTEPIFIPEHVLFQMVQAVLISELGIRMRLPNSPFQSELSNCWTRFGVGWVLDSTSQEFARSLDAYSPSGLGANPCLKKELGVKTRPCFVGKASYGYVWRR